MIEQTTAAPRTLDGRLVAVMALISGLVVANSYYAQPIVGLIADDLGASTTSVGLVVTASQVGYAVGLALLVPLGDLVDRRRLLWWLIGATAVCLVVMAAAPTWQVLASAALLVGVGSVVGQIVVPLAASLAQADRRGRVIGNVMTGLLLGILLSRVVAGLIAEVAGWRAVFVTAVGLVLVAALLVRTLPRTAPATDVSYRELLASVVRLVREEPILRWRMAYGTLTYASFGVMWTSIGFLLAGPGYEWSDARIGLFTLVGVAGALAARGAGRLADRGHARGQTGVLLAVTALSAIPLAMGEHGVIALAIGVAALDLGIQGTHITNQSVFYPLRPDARSRLNTAYMTSYFAAGSVGSIASVFVYAEWGWTGVCVLGALFPAVGFAAWLVESVRR
ncbi:MFS transporter [Gordonia humi]|uniref:Putative MFS family arabinose efflux permease n=1 Tax=Gordonia humi TaxID=686429 RepID=A0A840ESL2_9ACTN|nr:MFS transporter [Gordonia humi]MBB4135855.1 putative MFS family arabinose efflux permease [Gordonia humi]